MLLPINILSWLVSLTPLFLIIGPAVINISIVLINFVFLICIYQEKKYSYFTNKYFLVFTLICILFIISSLFSDHILHSLSSSLFYFRFGLLSLSIVYLVNYCIYFPKLFLSVLSVVFLFLICDSFFQFFSGYNILGYEYNGFRLSSVFGEEKILGSYFSRLFPIFFGLVILIFKKSFMPIILGLSVLVLIDILIFLSGERTAFFYLILFSVSVIILLKDWRLIRLSALILSILIIIILVNYQPNLKHRMITQTINQTQLLEQNKRIFSNEHENIYKIALDLFFKKPILGIGPKNFRIDCQSKVYEKMDGCRSHPHNIYIQLLSEAGIIAFMIFFSFFIKIIYQILKQIYYLYFLNSNYLSNFSVCFILAVLINLWPLIPTGNFFSSYLNVFYYLSFGFYFANFQEIKEYA